jgi:hypothetical protein
MKIHFRQKFLALAGACALLISTSAFVPSALSATPTVVELFTSQGCSSCPPADAILGKLKLRDDIIALTFPVDYWDYLGWKDTLASPAFSKRQRDYARARGDRQVYTPQMVMNGRIHVVGNQKGAVERGIKTVARDENITLSMKADGDDIRVSATIDSAAKSTSSGKATLWLVLFKGAETVKIGRGENSGNTFVYSNVVRQMTPIGMWEGKPMTINLPKSQLIAEGYDGCVVLLQRDDTREIVAAAMMDNLK